ncbi:hypothetical protein RMN57_22905 [Kitasatospora sp. CM 4170]|uniref:DUF3168 domain-containing protein n=1 Tax=Kitasatospora aburaviensis TaxID=67265 RepID=A0ABW1EZM2_9ACTN|nr:hypothetical protein [Kitasatospora sp. CM 4170]WNM47343.1 hypothetical protein RMN57_22905 [Kitasatospora sp. CM 4170]
MTESAARAQLLQHLTETLRNLPAGSALVRLHPDLPKAAFNAGATVRFEHDLADVDETIVPARFNIAYWVSGLSPADSDRNFDLLLEAWRDSGWRTNATRDAGPRAGYADTIDGFHLALQQSVQGYLSLHGSTPRFWPGPDEGSPLPDRIDHPA